MLTVATAALAAFPEKPLKLIVPFPPGGAADVMARGMAQYLGQDLGQQIIIENKAGAGGAMAAEMVARAPADGYTLLFGTLSIHAIVPAMSAKLRYDPQKDFAPIALTHTAPRVLVVSSALNIKTVAELIALAKKEPKLVTYGSAGIGSANHLSGALFESLANVDMLHVPYKGSAPLLTDLLGGRINIAFDSYAVYQEHINSGKVRALAVSSKSRMGVLPQVPTLDEAGLKGYEVSNWLGVLAPAGVSKEVLGKLHASLGRAMATPALRSQLIALGIEPTFNTPDEFAALLRSERPKWAEIVKRSGAKTED
jgi:tripartite-type tricarboxylate transporter receptor subunit TctC